MKLMRLIPLIVLCLVDSASAKRHKPGKQFTAFNQNIVELCEQNTFFRKEVITGAHSQIMVMSVPAGEDLGEDSLHVDQIYVFVEGRGQAVINNTVSEIYSNHLCFVPAETKYNFRNTGDEDLKLYVIFAPGQNKLGTVEKSKASKKAAAE